nr:hypothetical protein [uncultured Flavobacterium sp.]
MDIIEYKTIDGKVILNPDGNTYIGSAVNRVLIDVFIRHNIDTYHAQKDVLDFALKHGRLK